MADKQRPIILEIEDAKSEIITAVNRALTERGIPCYLFAPVMREICSQVDQGAKNELDALKAAESAKTKEGADK